MPRNAAGVYSLPETPVVAGTTIEPTPENSTRDDIAAELTSSLDRAGRGAMTAGLKIVDGSLGTPGLNFASDPDNGIYRTGVNTWHLVAAGAVVVTFGPGVVSIPGTVVFSMNTPLSVASGGTGAATAAAARAALDVPSNAEAVLKADSAITVPRVNTLIIDSNAAVDISLRTNNGTEQVQINHVASANRSLVLSGSNGGNPSIGVTGGAIALTTDTVIGGVLTVNSLVSGAGTFSGAVTGATAAGAMVATQAEQETGTATDKLVTSGRQHFHPSAVKFWVIANISGTSQASYNVTSVTDDGVGLITVTIATDFSSVNWVPFGLPEADTVVFARVQHASVSAGAAQVQVMDVTGTLTDPTRFTLCGLGDQ